MEARETGQTQRGSGGGGLLGFAEGGLLGLLGEGAKGVVVSRLASADGCDVGGGGGWAG